jgi:hypothetical protein
VDEPITAFRERFDEPWLGRGISEHVAQFADGLVDGPIEIEKCPIVPEPSANLLTSYDESRVLNQCEQQAERLLTEPDSGSALSKLASFGVELVHIEPACRHQLSFQSLPREENRNIDDDPVGHYSQGPSRRNGAA